MTKSNKETLDPDMYKKEATKISVTNKVRAETSKYHQEKRKIKAEELKVLKEIAVLDQEILLKRLGARRNIKADKSFDILIKMMFLSNIMTSTYAQDSNLPGNNLFEKDELMEYKAKMLELLKQL
jgi:hypothetical protein